MRENKINNEVISLDKVTWKRPGNGISPDKIKTIKNPLNREFISELIALKTLLKDSKTKK